MADMKFTPSQQDAIDARGGSILVSAAAGSGKTRVLVQRVINLITDRENPVDADRMLIVTFTNAAASEMKSRISSALDELLVSSPNDEFLRRQQILLPRADICTIHSFCSKVIRENFYLLDINQDYRIGNESEISVIKRNILSDIIEEMYESKREDFSLLSEIFSNARSDSELEKTILDVYEKSRSHPFPEKWIEEVTEFYNPEVPFTKTVFAMKAFDSLNSVLEFVKPVLAEVNDIIQDNRYMRENKKSSAQKTAAFYADFINSLSYAEESKSISEVSAVIDGYEKPRYTKPRAKDADVSEEEHNKIKACFEVINSAITERLVSLFGFTEEIYNNDTKQLYPVMRCLAEILKEFDSRFFETKKEKGILDFSDLEHLMLKLLVKDNNGEYQKTDFANSISEQYDEIMIDEYQDTNEAQEMIFRSISKNESNMFVVGDVKQSIYRFREAMPEIFIKRRENCTLYDRNNPSFPTKIILDRNFRSREGIIESVNFVFERLMSMRVGEIEYNDDEKLVTGASYPETAEPEVELHIIQNSKSSYSPDEFEDLSNDEAEAKHIVNIINQMIKDGFQVKDGSEMRNVRYGDFCILLRNLSSHARVFSDILNRSGIPAYTDKPYSLFTCYEVNAALSFLKIIDNPVQDIPMLSVMMSPVFGFTPDDLAVIKSASYEQKGKSLYAMINAFSVSEEENNIQLKNKCLNFIDILKYYRRMSVTVKTDTLLNMFFEKSGYISIVSAMKNGKIRVQNLRKLMNFVRDYENGSNSGLTGFIRLVNRLEENGTDINAGDTASSDSVKIMSVHHSKGLEFPICIMASTASKGNNKKDTVLCHSKLGLGINTVDREKMLKYSTFQRTVIDSEIDREGKSEELRVLYVAMTRAKEKLIMLSSIKSDYSSALQKIAVSMRMQGQRISEYSVENAKTLSDWIIMCALLHPSMKELRYDADVENIKPIPTKSIWKFVRVTDISESSSENIEDKEYIPKPDNKMMKFLEKRFSEKYPFENRTAIPSKVTASMLAHDKIKPDFIAALRPSFMLEKNMTGAERGTALHAFMHYADIGKMKTSPETEKQYLLENGFISSEQYSAINLNDIKNFTDSSLYNRMLSADKLYREYRFTVNISANDIDENSDCNENVILQGAADCIFIEGGHAVIVDYKTDRVKDLEKLVNNYSKQLELYKKAVESVFRLPVKECIIYSLYIGKYISINPK